MTLNVANLPVMIALGNGIMVELRLQIMEHELAIAAMQDRGTPGEQMALDLIQRIQTELPRREVRFISLERNTPTGNRVDCVRIPLNPIVQKS